MPSGDPAAVLADFLRKPRGEDLYSDFALAESFRLFLRKDPSAARVLRAEIPLAHGRMTPRKRVGTP